MKIVLLTAFAGIVGTGLGGLISVVLIRRSAANITPWLLSFAAGIMTSIACFGLIPQALSVADITVAVVGLVFGVLATLYLNRVVDKITESRSDKLQVHQSAEELYHAGQLIQNPRHLLKSGVVMLFAIGLHHIPEGIAIGAGGSYDIQFGILLALVLGLHAIPEGMAIAAPLLAGGVSRGKVVALTALSGTPTILGGLIGWLVGGISTITLALALSFAGGAMLYVVFGEIIPHSVVMTKSRKATIVTLIGIIIGLLVTRF